MPPIPRGMPELQRDAVYRAVFGPTGRARKAAAWNTWFTGQDENGFGRQALEALATAGCERKVLTALLVEVRWTLYLHRMSTPQVQAVGVALDAARLAFASIGNSTLVYHFGLADAFDPNHGSRRLEGDLKELLRQWKLQARSAAAHKENVAFAWAVANLVNYVKRRTRTFQDERVTTLIVIATGNERFSANRWRRDNANALRDAQTRVEEMTDALRAKAAYEREREWSDDEAWPASGD